MAINYVNICAKLSAGRVGNNVGIINNLSTVWIINNLGDCSYN